MHDWKTIAPVMLPIARVSLLWRTQMRLLNFSGSSVAIGRDDQRQERRIEARRRRDVLDRVDEDERAADDHGQRHEHLQVDDAQPRRASGPRGSAARSTRCKRSGARSAASTVVSASKCDLTYQRVDAEQQHDRAVAQRTTASAGRNAAPTAIA